ncbi:LysR family transcriptional regulator [Pseudonocardia kunmingensis]|uniref:DNA-binding transcriptional LysR family regulator n=1 Tax=Pseudonocardia kunmingensis TaxID=630975 RepID=A0A543D4C3_9PSEU|nr:LysR family transcriptional regulator [Pseudonocardia kunmingensis]TQM04190.1 DNA-binding transcriptional LysR family regulator [Pseudonocardia kunmingensis]
MLDVRRLRLLRELSHRGTIAAVAEALAYTPSAVSQQLSALEREAGTALLTRGGRRVTLTPAALTLVAHSESVLAQLERAEADLAACRGGPAGPLRIGTFPSAARTVVPAALAALAAAHPDLEPRLHELDPAAVAAALRAGEVDVALVHDYDFVPAPPDPGVGTTPLFDEAMFLAAPHALAPQPDEPDPLRRWHAAPWIVAPPATRCGAMAVRACEAAGFSPRVRHVVDDFPAVLALVGIGGGVALVPELGVATADAAVALTPVPMHRRTLAAFRAGAGADPAIAAFVDAVRAAAPRGTTRRPVTGSPPTPPTGSA